MKKFLIALLAALLVVGMFTVAMAEPATSEYGGSDVETNCDLGVHSFTKTIVYRDGDECTGIRYYVKTCEYCDTRDARENWVKVEDDGMPNPLGHLFTNPEASKDAKCNESGVMTMECQRCHKTITLTEKTMSPEHNWVKLEVGKGSVAPTCTQKGVNKYVCAWCGEIKDEEVKATGVHKFILDNCDVIERADCENDGYREGLCTMCGEKFSGKDAKGKTDGTAVLVIPARGHDYHDVIIKKQVTCKADGLISYYCTHTKGDYLYKACTKAVENEVVKHDVTAPNLLTGTVINKYHKLVKEVLTPASAKTGDFEVFVYKCTVCDYVSAQMSAKVDTTPATIDPAPVVPGDTKPEDTKPADTKPSKPSNTTNSKGVSIPKTNDTTSNLPYVLIAVAFVGLVALVASKRKVNG